MQRPHLRMLAAAGVVSLVALMAPAHEAPPKPLAEITLTLDASLPAYHSQVYQGTLGDLWMLVQGPQLWQWTGDSWKKAPVVLPVHPNWLARSAPPWADWQREPILRTGKEGVVLIITVRDLYQGIDQETPDRHKWRDHVARKIEERKLAKPYWLEGWLYEDGQWTGPVRLDELLVRDRKRLAKAFAAPAGVPGFCALQGDGDNLWAASDGNVTLIRADGTAEQKAVALEGKPRPLQPTSLVRVADNRVWLTQPSADGYRVTELTMKDGHIDAAPLAAAALKVPHAYHYQAPHYHVARSGATWCWLPHGEEGNGDLVYQWKDGGWQERRDLGRFCLEDTDGALWFLRGRVPEDWGKDPGYRVVRGEQTTTFSLPMEWRLGLVTRVDDGHLLAACLERPELKGRLAMLVRQTGEREPRWTLGETYTVTYYLGRTPCVFVDGKGHVVEQTGWAGIIPKKE